MIGEAFPWGDFADPRVKHHRDATSWLIASHLLAYKDTLTVFVDTGAGGGQYDLLSIRDTEDASAFLVDMNRHGSIHVKAPGENRLWWPDAPYDAEMVAAAAAKTLRWRLAKQRATRPVEGIAALIGETLLKLGPEWEIVSGLESAPEDWDDASDDPTVFDTYPEARRMLDRTREERRFIPEGGFFFLVRRAEWGTDKVSEAAFHVDGFVWWPDNPPPLVRPDHWDMDTNARRNFVDLVSDHLSEPRRAPDARTEELR